MFVALLAALAVGGWLFWRWRQPPPPFAAVVTLGYVESPARSYYEPFGVAADEDGNLYFSESITGRIYKLAAESYQTGAQSQVTVIAENLETPSALALDGDGNLIVANTGAHTILRIDLKTKSVTRLAGEAGVSGDADGKDARFNGPVGVTVGEDGTIFVADTYNDRIRAISPDGQVRTIAGDGEPGFVDGAGTEARFDTPCGIAVAKDGSLIVADTGNHRIRSVAPNGQVTTVAGNGDAHERNGAPMEAAFEEPTVIVIRNQDSFYVADAGGGAVRLVSLKSSAEVQPFVKTELPETGFNRPTGLAVLPNGELAIAESGNSLIRALVPAGSKLGNPVDRRSLVLSAERLRELVAPRWPFYPPEAKRDIAGTFGEVRGEVQPEHDAWFHNGLDVPGAYGELARAIFTEPVTRPLAVEGAATTRERVRLPLFGYIHVKIGRDQNDQLLPNFGGGAVTFRRDAQGQINGVRLRRGTRIKAGDPIGALNRLNHVHLIAGQPGAEFNALAALRLPGISDSISPVIEAVIVADEQGNTLVDSMAKKDSKNAGRLKLNGRLRIFVRAYDQADGNAKYRRLGLYRVGYQILTAAGTPAPSFDDTRRNIEFDRLPADWRTVPLVYAVGSQSGYEGATVFKYIATNRLRGGEVREDFFDTSKLPPGDYTLRALAEDFFGNRAQRDLPITVTKANQ
ncbi:MAG TPA: hypothetical protein PKC13_19540 [Blastocatellia bacterium]|nr:hypothetical protein [Blastocatellia bacterium]